MVNEMANCPLQLGREVKRLSVTIGTVSLPLLRPQNPARIFELSEQDSILIVEQSFSAKRKVPLTKGHSSAAKRKVPLTKGHSSAAKRKVPLTKGHSPSPRRKSPTKKGYSPSAKRKVPLTKGPSPSPKKNDRAVPYRIGT